ncbi:MAG: hypothetical protein WC748_09970 [Legionellales bacterium]
MSELMIKIGVDAKDVAPGVKSALAGMNNFKSKMASFGEMKADFGGYLKRNMGQVADGMNTAGNWMTGAGVGMVAALSKTVMMANEAIESENLFSVALGENANDVRIWSETLRKNLGLNSFEVRKNSAVFYAMFESMKIGKKDSLELSKGLTQLAYDMSSFYNIRIDEAFLKLQAGISGESEPLKRLGILVNETTTKNYALSHGIIKQGEAMTEQQKVMARYGLIMESTQKAQGDLGRTLDSPTNKLRIMKEQLNQVSIEMGMQLMPIQKMFITELSKLTGFLSSLTQEQMSNLMTTIKWVAGILLIGGPILKATAFIINMKLAMDMLKLAQLATAAASVTSTATIAASWTTLLPVFGAVALAILAIVAALQLAAAYQSQVIDEYKRGDATGDKTKKMVTANKQSLKQRADNLGISLPQLRDMMQKEKGWKGNQGLALDAVTGSRLKQYETGKMQVPQSIKAQSINKPISYNMQNGQMKNNVNVRVFVDDDMKLKAQVIETADTISQMNISKRLAV